jgi:hypothetical protein
MNMQWSFNLFERWPAKVLGLIFLIFFVWLSCVTVAVLINAFTESNGVLNNFH